MSQLKLLTLLQQIRRTAELAESRFGGASDTLAAFTDKGALEQIEAAACEAIKLITVGETAALASAEPRSQSSVEIKESAKGEPSVTVKAYEGSPIEGPAAVAISTYLSVKRDLAAQQTGGATP